MNTRRNAFTVFIIAVLAAMALMAAPSVAFAGEGEAGGTSAGESASGAEPAADPGGGQADSSVSPSSYDASAQVEAEPYGQDAGDAGASGGVTPGAANSGSADGPVADTGASSSVDAGGGAVPGDGLDDVAGSDTGEDATADVSGEGADGAAGSGAEAESDAESADDPTSAGGDSDAEGTGEAESVNGAPESGAVGGDEAVDGAGSDEDAAATAEETALSDEPAADGAAVPDGAKADAANVGQSGILAEGSVGAALDDDEAEALLAAASAEGVSSKDLISLVQKLIMEAVTGDPKKMAETVVDWGLGKLLQYLFGGSTASENSVSLSDIMEGIGELQNSINELKDTVKSAELNSILTDLDNRMNSQGLTPYIIFGSLKKYDDQLKAGDITEDTAKQYRLQALTDDISIGEKQWSAVNNPFDLYVQSLWRAMTEVYPVTLNGGSNLTLMQIFYEHLRTKYHWEHQAYDEWSNYQSRYVGLLSTALTLEKASLQARIELLRKDGRSPESVIGLLAKIQDYLNQISGYEGKDPLGNDVNYQGIFSEKSWAEQYWMYKERPDYRYYWKPGHEVLFYAEVNTQEVPQEWEHRGLLGDHLRGVKVHWSDDPPNWLSDYTCQIKYDFWKPFVRYQGGDSPLVSADQLKHMFEDYGSSTHLYDIFMSSKEGNFKGLHVGNVTTWWFVVDADKAHPLTYDYRVGRGDRLLCYVMRSSNATIDTSTLCYYHRHYTEPNTSTHFIGIGVARVGPETYNPKNSDPTYPDPPGQAHTAVLYDQALWCPSFGDLALAYGEDTHGGVERVLVDGREIAASCYVVKDAEIVFTRAFLESLGYGEHEFFLDTREGGHTFVFSTQVDGVYYVESGGGIAWTPGSGDGMTFVFKRTTDDGVTFSRLLDVLVDGVPVPSWGYVARAGSAVVTLTAALLDTLAPGVHTLTAVFADGNDPQARFTVNASGALPATAAGAAGPAQPEQTPRTGDGSALPVALLALVALASAGVAVRARRRA